MCEFLCSCGYDVLYLCYIDIRAYLFLVLVSECSNSIFRHSYLAFGKITCLAEYQLSMLTLFDYLRMSFGTCHVIGSHVCLSLEPSFYFSQISIERWSMVVSTRSHPKTSGQ